MTASALISAATHPALLKRLQRWIWTAIAFSFLLAGTITWIHFDYMNAVDRTSRLLENFRTARIDMAKGFLYVSLSGDQSSPFERGQGFALLQQSINDYYAVSHAIELQAEMDSTESQIYATFARTLDSFTGMLKEWKTSTRANSLDEARMRIAFYDLERQSERLDMGIREHLALTRQTQNRIFAAAITVSVFLLAGICSALLLSVRAVRRSDLTLMQSEDRFARTFHGMPVALAITRLSDGRIMDVNDSFLRLFGCSREEAVGNTTVSLKIFTTPEERMDIIDRLGSDGSIQDHTVIMHTTKGDPRWILLSAEPLTLENETFSLTSFLDITQRKRAEDELVESKRKYQDLVDNMNEGLVHVDHDDRILFVNDRFCQMVGYSRHELIGNIGYELFVSERNRPLIREKNRARRHGVSERYEVQLIKRNGETIWVNVGASPMKNDRGEVTGSLGVFTDITERIQYEKTLEDNEALLQETGRIAKVGAWSADLTARMITWTDIVAQIHDHDGTFTMPMERWFDVYRAGSRETIERAMTEASATGRPFDHILEMVTSKGNRKWVRVIGHPVLEEHRVRAVRGSMQDVTIIKAAEELMRESEDRLFHAQKMDSIGTLAAGIAHDFNNILGIMMGYADLMRVHLHHPEKLEHALAMITNSINRGAGLVKQLLTFARKTPTIYAPTDVNHIVNELRTLFNETFPKTITIDISLMPGLPEIDADATQIHQVVLNLCVNARDAMPRGGTLSIATRLVDCTHIPATKRETQCSHYVSITISDTGMGMDETVQKRIFEPFFTTKEPGKGTGLGLSVVFGIIENHQGVIDVKSEIGKGTVFTLYLPVPAREPALEITDADFVESSDSGTETILVVEDEPMLRSLIEESLHSKGYTVLSADTGTEGYRLYMEHRAAIAAVFSDVGMPGIDGVEMARRIRTVDPEAKIILASGFLSPEARRDMEAAGVTHFAQKPCPVSTVLHMIRAVIDEGSGA